MDQIMSAISTKGYKITADKNSFKIFFSKDYSGMFHANIFQYEKTENHDKHLQIEKFCDAFAENVIENALSWLEANFSDVHITEIHE